MITYIESFTVNYHHNYFKFDRSFYEDPKKNTLTFPGDFYRYQSVIIWKYNNRKYMYSTELVWHMPCPDFNGIAFISREDKTKLIICNPDASERFILSPPDFLQMEEYEKRDFSAHFFRFPATFERFDHYFEYNGKKYLTVKISLYENESCFFGISQLRYLDVETGDFLPFTKTIFTTTMDFESGNPHAAPMEKKIDL